MGGGAGEKERGARLEERVQVAQQAVCVPLCIPQVGIVQGIISQVVCCTTSSAKLPSAKLPLHVEAPTSHACHAPLTLTRHATLCHSHSWPAPCSRRKRN